MPPAPVPETLVERARAGDGQALESLVAAIKDDVYNLALRMLWHPADAEDATQEILLRVVTHLATFRGQSAFRTWVYRVAANALLRTRRRRMERPEMTFDWFGQDLAEGLSDAPLPSTGGVDEHVLLEEVKIGCTQGMLLCLDRQDRLAYILGAVFELPSEVAADVLEISPVAFRKRLQRARDRLRTFLQGHCGLVDPANACRCRRRVQRAVELGRVDPHDLLFAGRPTSQPAAARRLLAEGVEQMERLHAAADDLYRSAPWYAAPPTLQARVRQLVTASGGPLLGPPPAESAGRDEPLTRPSTTRAGAGARTARRRA